MSLRLRLLLTLVPLFVVGLVAADIATYAALQSYLTGRVDQQVIQAHIPIENSLLGNSSSGAVPADAKPQSGGPGNDFGPFPQGTYGELRDSSGKVLKAQNFTYTADTSNHPALPTNLKPGTPDHPALLTVRGAGTISSYRVYVDSTHNGSGDVVIAAVPLSDLQATLGQLLLLELAVSAAVTALLTLASLVIVRRSLVPLERIGETARSIVAQGLNTRVAPASERTEVGRLGLALNEMLAELEAAFAARAASQARLKQFVSDASHELRTPLTSMRGYAELLRSNEAMAPAEVQTAARRIEDEAKRLGVLVDDLLLLARLDQGRDLQHDRVDLEALLKDAASDTRAADSSRRVSARVLAPLVIDGDELRLRQVLGNVIRNALVHTPPGTPVEIVLREDAGAAVLEVVDHGAGIAPADMGRIFERFHRADPDHSRDRGGSGLGLSIAAAVVTAHGGQISVHETAGGGATFRITLPLKTPSEL